MRMILIVAALAAFAAVDARDAPRWHSSLLNARRKLTEESPSPSSTPNRASPSSTNTGTGTRTGTRTATRSPAISRTPTATASLGASLSVTPSASPTRLPSPSGTPTPLPSQSPGASPSASPLPPVVVTLVQSLSNIDPAQLINAISQSEEAREAMVTAGQELRAAMVDWLRRQTGSDIPVIITGLIDALTGIRSAIGLDHPLNQNSGSLRLLAVVDMAPRVAAGSMLRGRLLAATGVGIEYGIQIPAANVESDDGSGSAVQSAQSIVAQQVVAAVNNPGAVEAFNLAAQDAVVSVAVAAGAVPADVVAAIDPSTASVYVPPSGRTTTTPSASDDGSKYPAGAIVGIVLGTVGGILLISLVAYKSGGCRKAAPKRSFEVRNWDANGGAIVDGGLGGDAPAPVLPAAAPAGSTSAVRV